MPPPAPAPDIAETSAEAPPMDRPYPRYRWLICALLFFATTINYLDRQIIGVLKPILEKELGWNQVDYSNIVVAFQAAYAIGLVSFGWLIDKLGVRAGFALAVGVWSLAAMAHGVARSVTSFALARFGLGLAEAGNFPAAVKTVGEWFPKKERAFATGLFNSGSNIGAMITPLLVPWIALNWGWEMAFFATGAVGFVWLALWLMVYRPPPAAAESAVVVKKIPWMELFRYRQTWMFAIGKFMTDPIWWLYLFWVPDFLFTAHGLGLKEFGPPLLVIYLMSDVGSIAGGWLSSRLIRAGWTVNAARKSTMLACALLVVPIFAASMTSDLWVATILIGIAASAHQGWSANLFTLVTDTVPANAVGSVVGIGGMAGAIGGVLIAKLVGYVLTATNNNYLIPFVIASSAYLVALGTLHLINPKLLPMAPQTIES